MPGLQVYARGPGLCGGSDRTYDFVMQASTLPDVKCPLNITSL